ncbi:YcaO-like family protein [Stappia sp.]|uniref:YcaO-like family protein n=1 Tax=Stappia sp. TaxID=1870903 RepID=UPI003A99D745
MIEVFERNDFRTRFSWSSILSPSCGIVRSVAPIDDEELGVPDFRRRTARLCNVSLSYPWIRAGDGSSAAATLTAGNGGDLNADMAYVRAVAEAAERYASSIFDENDYILTSANELGSAALDHRRWPKCDAAELADPHCQLHAFDPDRPIRWVEGYSLTQGRKVWLPLVMSHLVFELLPGEAFWAPITTGIAIHSCPYRAAVSAICESIERDAIALTWICRLPLPRLVVDSEPPEQAARTLARIGTLPLQHEFYDATTDLGVPTVYLLQKYEGHPQLSTFVGCSTEFDPWTAYGKVVREACVARTAIPFFQDIPDDPLHFSRLEYGASYMGRPEQAAAFDFLSTGRRETLISRLGPDCGPDPRDEFDWLVARFKALDFELTLVDLTTDDLREAGLSVIRAFTPDLMPLDFLPSARYLGHARLQSYPPKAGYGHFDRAAANPYPQPFA